MPDKYLLNLLNESKAMGEISNAFGGFSEIQESQFIERIQGGRLHGRNLLDDL